MVTSVFILIKSRDFLNAKTASEPITITERAASNKIILKINIPVVNNSPTGSTTSGTERCTSYNDSVVCADYTRTRCMRKTALSTSQYAFYLYSVTYQITMKL